MVQRISITTLTGGRILRFLLIIVFDKCCLANGACANSANQSIAMGRGKREHSRLVRTVYDCNSIRVVMLLFQISCATPSNISGGRNIVENIVTFRQPFETKTILAQALGIINSNHNGKAGAR